MRVPGPPGPAGGAGDPRQPRRCALSIWAPPPPRNPIWPEPRLQLRAMQSGEPCGALVRAGEHMGNKAGGWGARRGPGRAANFICRYPRRRGAGGAQLAARHGSARPGRGAGTSPGALSAAGGHAQPQPDWQRPGRGLRRGPGCPRCFCHRRARWGRNAPAEEPDPHDSPTPRGGVARRGSPGPPVSNGERPSGWESAVGEADEQDLPASGHCRLLHLSGC